MAASAAALQQARPELVELVAGGFESGCGGVDLSAEWPAGVSLPGGGSGPPLEALGIPEPLLGLCLDTLAVRSAHDGGGDLERRAEAVDWLGLAHEPAALVLFGGSRIAGPANVRRLSAPELEVTGLSVVAGVAFRMGGFSPVWVVGFVGVVVLNEAGDFLGAEVAFRLHRGLLSWDADWQDYADSVLLAHAGGRGSDDPL